MFDYLKKISIGYCVGETYEAYNEFFKKYHQYIHNIYFSIPLGDRFHARTRICSGLRSKESVELMWEVLKLAKDYDVKIEIVFNTPHLNLHDFKIAYTELRSRNLEVDLVCILDEYYSFAKEFFADKELVHSFNNFYNTEDDYIQNKFHYEQYVIGRQNIRNFDLFKFIKEKKQGQVVLLLNNGCSFQCGGCKEKTFFCHNAYYSQLKEKSPEELYAIQSIMPFELNDNYLDASNIDYVKISTRNSGLNYASCCIDSYIHPNGECLIEETNENYGLWGRQTWHAEFYETFNIERIIEVKKNLYSNTKNIYTKFLKNKYYLQVSDNYSFKIIISQWDALRNFMKKNQHLFSTYIISGIIVDYYPSKDIMLALEEFAKEKRLEIHRLQDFTEKQDCRLYKSDSEKGIYFKNAFNHTVRNDFSVYNGSSRIIKNYNDNLLGQIELRDVQYIISPMPLNGVLLRYDEPFNLKLVLDLYYSGESFYFCVNEGVLKTISEARFDLVLRL